MSDDEVDITKLVQKHFNYTITVKDINNTFYVDGDLKRYNPEDFKDFKDFLTVYGSEGKVQILMKLVTLETELAFKANGRVELRFNVRTKILIDD